jgi:hypothetical protein
MTGQHPAVERPADAAAEPSATRPRLPRTDAFPLDRLTGGGKGGS